MSLLDAFLWLGETPPGQFLKASTFAFSMVESSHLLGLALLGGTVLAADLGALRVIFRSTPAVTVADGVSRAFWTALALVAVSGVLLVAAGPYKYYTNPLFPVKLALLVVALALQVGVLTTLRRGGAERLSRGLAGASLVFWLSTLVAGRWLGLI
ncbi:DUF6644 family protein [Caulobacter sp.]|jgi:hypothetical protein|uniref:DUF6644 family protein n=1 Tax=Caulobacter sp. TaxID=78 RepID=UPI0031D69723